MAEYETILTERHGDVLVITLNRPERLNACPPQMADEIGRADTLEAAFAAYRDRRFDRCRYIVEQSRAISYGQTGQGPLMEQGAATKAMTDRVAEPI